MGEKPSISYHQSTGYHSYMFHNNIALNCRPCLSSFIDPRPLAIHSHTRRRSSILPDSRSVTAAVGSTRDVLKIARRRTAITNREFCQERVCSKGLGMKRVQTDHSVLSGPFSSASCRRPCGRGAGVGTTDRPVP